MPPSACHSSVPVRKKSRLWSTLPLTLILLASWTARVQAQNPEGVPEEVRVISPESRVIPRTQMPDRWITWRNRRRDCGLMASVWDFLVLPDVPAMLANCDKPLCNMLKAISKQKSDGGNEEFTNRCGELVELLGYSSSEEARIQYFHGIPTMARLLLKLSSESEEIRERFMAHTDVKRFCKGITLEDNVRRIKAPFTIVQQLHYDFITDKKGIFEQASAQSESYTVRREHLNVANWMRDIFRNREFAEAAGLDDSDTFFSCPEGEDQKPRQLTLAFRFRFMDKKATHATFLMQGIPKWLIRSQGKTNSDPDTERDYPGQISLETNRGVWENPGTKQSRRWDLYSTYLLRLVRPGVGGAEPIYHVFPQWYPYGADQPPPGEPICYTFDRRVQLKLSSNDSIDECNRIAQAQVMFFVATRK